MKPMKTTLLFLLFALALSGCMATKGTSPKGLEGPIEKAAIKFSADQQAGGYRVVSTEELRKWLAEERELTLISTLSRAEEEQFGHLPDDVNATMPLAEKDITPEDRVHLLMAAGSDKQRTIVVYCGYLAYRRSHVGAKLLVEYGYKNVYRYPAGIIGWREAGQL